MTVKLKCLGCNRIVEVKDDYDHYATCSKCGKYFEEYNYNEQDDEDDNDEDNECIICGSDKDIISWDSNDCDDYSDYDYLVICKKCIDKKYLRQVNTVYKEKVIEKPIIKYIDKNTNEEIKPNILEKSRFD